MARAELRGAERAVRVAVARFEDTLRIGTSVRLRSKLVERDPLVVIGVELRESLGALRPRPKLFRRSRAARSR